MPIPINSHDLRWLAEEADGRRGHPLKLIRDPVTGRPRFLRDGEPEGADQLILDVLTTNARPHRHEAEITCTVQGVSNSLEGCDAVFWTESAVEKFFWPYYHAHNIFDEPIERLHKEYYAPNSSIVAIAHVPPSRPVEINDTRESVMVVVVEVAGVGGNIEATSSAAPATVRAHRLGDYLRRRP